MTPEARIEALAAFRVTLLRQARFLLAVLKHGGVCVPRQDATFAQTAYGHTVNRFFERLVAARYAVPSGCLHNRARVFHLQHRGLYEAIAEPHSPFPPTGGGGPRGRTIDAAKTPCSGCPT